MVEPARLLARLAAGAGQPTFAYRFSYVASSLRAQTKGALHATEIPFVFATVRAKYADAASAEDEATGAAANAYWAAFARTGDPNGEGRPKWPAFSVAGDVVMDFGVGGAVAKADPWKARLDVIERFAAPAPAGAPTPARVPTPERHAGLDRGGPGPQGHVPDLRPESERGRLAGRLDGGLGDRAPGEGRQGRLVGERGPFGRGLLQLLVRRRWREDGRSQERAHQAGCDEHRQHADGPGPRDGAHRSEERASRRDPDGVVSLEHPRRRAAPARLHAARLRREPATASQSFTCCTAAATRTPAGTASGAPVSSPTTCSRPARRCR